MTPYILFILGIVVSLVSSVAIFLLLKYLDHEKRIQSLEEVTGNDVKELKQDMRDLKNQISDINTSIITLSNNFHKERSQENQLNGTLTGLNKTIIAFQDIMLELKNKL